jgi:hypothetical protein
VAGKDVRTVRRNQLRSFLVVFPPSVHPRTVEVRLRMTDGSERIERGDANLVPTPKRLEDVR